MRQFKIRACVAAPILALLVAACGSVPPAPEPVARDDFNGVQRQLENLIQHEMAQYKLAGLSIALVDDQRFVWAKGFGWADAVAKVPASPETRYRVGSISKLFTDTAAMQLVAENRLDLDAPVQRVLPWFSIGSTWSNKAPMTLRQLTTHHSGLPRDVAGGMWLQKAPSPAQDFRTMLHSLADTQLDAPPELMLSYSNIGLDVVGAMIETASGQPFEQRLQQSVLMPLGMRNAQFSAAMPTDAAMARGHFKGEGQIEPALRDVPAGGLNASVTDLARFVMMQFAAGRNSAGEVVLPAAQQAAMLERQYPDQKLDADMHVGLGWMFTTFGINTVHGGGLVAHHGGATMYFRSQLMLLPQHKLGVIVAANDGAAGDVVNRVAQRALALLLEARSGIRQSTVTPRFVPSGQPWTGEQWQAVRTACAGDYMTLVGPVSLKPDGHRMSMQAGDRQLELREGEAGRFGLGYRLAGLLSINLGPLSNMSFECIALEGRQVLLAVLDGQRMLVGERLGTPSLPANVARWTGRYRPRLSEGEMGSLGANGEVRVFVAEGRLWAEYQLHPAFGGAKVRVLLLPFSDTAARAVGPLADTGPVIQLENPSDEAPRVRFSGWLFDRFAE